MRSIVVVLLLGAILTGCASRSSGDASKQPATTTPPKSPLPSPVRLVVGGDRPATVLGPSSYVRGPAPLIMLLHGFGASGREQDEYMGLSLVAGERGAWFVAPDGTRTGSGERFWNATDACCDADRTGVDDSAYLAGLIAEITAATDIDPKRIYLVGHSNGGFMSYRMACDHADLIAAIASLAGASFAKTTDCAPSKPVSVLQIHGTSDDTVLYDGGTVSDVGIGTAEPRYPGAEATVAAWQAYDGCAASLTETAEMVDIDRLIDGSQGQAEPTVVRAAGCQPGGAVELWTIPRGGHVPELAPGFADSVVEFLFAHPKP